MQKTDFEMAIFYSSNLKALLSPFVVIINFDSTNGSIIYQT